LVIVAERAKIEPSLGDWGSSVRQRIIGVLVCVLVLSGAGSAVDASGAAPTGANRTKVDWPMHRFGPQRDGHNPFETTLSTKNVGSLRLKWVFDSQRFVDSSTAVVGGIAYFGSDDGFVRAVDIADGTQVWAVLKGQMENSSPAVADGVVYIHGTERLLALEAATGEERWSAVLRHGPFSPSSPMVLGETVYAGGEDGLLALDTADGTPRWTYAAAGGDPTAVLGPASTADQYGILYSALVPSSPAFANGIVYIGSSNGLHAVDAVRGTARWVYDEAGAVSSTSVAVADGAVYFAAGSRLYALDAASGVLRWSAETGGGPSSPAVAGDRVFIGSIDHNVYAFDAKGGRELWSYPTGDAIQVASPAVANGVVYIGSYDGLIYALDAKRGRKLWSYATDQIIEASPAVVNGEVFITSNDFRVYAFALDGAAAPPAPPLVPLRLPHL
jgi:eukaryotic-like serine/threonine-protein kinase